MSLRHPGVGGRQHGIVLVSSLLLLLVVTLLALAMFRGAGLGEKIAGNVREKQRALHAAVVAEQYAEWLLSSGNISTVPVSPCTTGAATNTSFSAVQVCQNGINPASGTLVPNPAILPWTNAANGGGTPVGFTYTLPSGSTQMNFTAVNNSYSNSYAQAPVFYIQYLGTAPDGTGGVVYKVDALGYGGSPLSVAVVESTYEVGSAVKNLTPPDQ